MTRVPQLTPRLLAVARQVPAGAKLADVGTDHAHLPVSLLRQGRVSQAIASDLRESPLERGRAVARVHGVENKISFRLCSGLSGVQPGEVDTVVIAGMGGDTITAILAEAPWLRANRVRLLLQPMSSLPELRVWLQSHGYAISREEVVAEGRRFYVVMTVEAGSMSPLTPGEAYAGRQTSESVSGPRGAYIADLLRRRRHALAGRTQGGFSSDVQEQEEALLAELEQMQKEWESWQR